MIGHVAPRRRPTDPFEDVLLPAGPASRRARRLTLGRMRPPPDLATLASQERRRQVERFLAALEAVRVGSGTWREPGGPVTIEVHDCAAGFWLIVGDGRVIPDPSGRAGMSLEELRNRVAGGDVVLDDVSAALRTRIGGDAVGSA